MTIFYFGVFLIGLFCVDVHGRAVNISSTWFLPQEGFPVFYRYFRDKVTWNEADAICEFHHGDLITVETSSQMDAARAYLKELDVLDHIWIGLMRESSDKPFTWMNGEQLKGDGYWLEQIPKSNSHLCVALDPTSDFRWSSYTCGGPQVASFICELPVPDWASKEDGCMITSLPSLTVTLVPEMGVVELFSDCGLDGTRRIACKGGVNHEEIIKRLSCDEDPFASTIFSKSTTDLTKETDSQSPESTWTNTNEDTISSSRDGITQSTKGWSWDPYEPQTRHRRDTNPSSPSTTQTLDNEILSSSLIPSELPSEALISSSSVQNITQVEIPSSTLAPIEKVATEKLPIEKAPIQKLPTEKIPIEKLPIEKAPTETLPVEKVPNEKLPIKSNISEITEIPIAQKLQNPVISTESPTFTPTSDLVLEPIVAQNMTSPDVVNDESLIIITGETLNRSVTPNTSGTSESPQVVVVINENSSETNRSDPYIVSLSDDIIINNPSLSPVEVIDVDVVELDKLTTKSTFVDRIIDHKSTSNPQVLLPIDKATSPKSTSEGTQSSVMTTEGNNQSTNVKNIPVFTDVKILSTKSIDVKTTKVPIENVNDLPEVPPSATNQDKYTENVGELEEEKGDESDVPQRPNRGRLFTHSNHPSFYPYFLNRVLG